MIQKVFRLAVILLAPVTVGVMGWRLLSNRSAPSGPAEMITDFGAVSDFQLTDQNGKPFGLSDLKGKTWLADFIFTRCGGPCPLLSKRMAALNKEFTDPNLRFVSFSVDPKHDTPSVLAKYAAKYNADDRWHFLTGDTQKVYSLILDSFRLAVAANPEEKSGEEVSHSLSFVRVDGAGRIRAYYTGSDDESLAKLKADLKAQL